MKVKKLLVGIVTAVFGLSMTNMITVGAESEKTLVAYYSASGTTKRIADFIAEEMNADVFAITPVYGNL